MTPPKRKPVKPPKRKMVQIHTLPVGRGLFGWAIKVEGRKVSQLGRQEDAESLAMFLGRLMAPASVKVHDRRGRIKPKGERTYDRKHDSPKPG